MVLESGELTRRCQAIELILSDVDGVLTNGGILFDNQGIELKQFHVRDGLGIRLWERAGYKFGILTARSSHIVKVRAAELGISIVRQGFEEKWPVAEGVLNELKLPLRALCYIGDDLADVPIIRRAGLGATVADGVNEAKAAAGYVAKATGGTGAVREIIEAILKAKGMWEEIVARY
jgi:3-deoxy-D-manno-octulosonate 8-phosphate phosphatase (KDO 8-P phosphatase)